MEDVRKYIIGLPHFAFVTRGHILSTFTVSWVLTPGNNMY